MSEQTKTEQPMSDAKLAENSHTCDGCKLFVCHKPENGLCDQCDTRQRIAELQKHLAASQERQAAQAAELERVKGERDELATSVSECPRAPTTLPPEFQRLWEACNRLIDKAEFRHVYKHLERLETALAAEREKVAALTRERDEAQARNVKFSEMYHDGLRTTDYWRDNNSKAMNAVKTVWTALTGKELPLGTTSLETVLEESIAAISQLAASQSRAERAEGELAKMREGAERVKSHFELEFNDGTRIVSSENDQVFCMPEGTWRLQPVKAIHAIISPPCPCYACQGDDRTRMIVCEQCGNKRCPHATHHDNACTGSNEPGQPGSRYSATPTPAAQEGE